MAKKGTGKWYECKICHKTWQRLTGAEGKIYCSRNCMEKDEDFIIKRAKQLRSLDNKKEKNARWSGGLHKCIDCGKLLTGYRQSRCRECYKISMTGENHFAWKKEDVDYYALHHWVNKYKGKATKCEHCGSTGGHTRGCHWANVSGEYHRDIADYISLCASCHKKYDQKERIAIRQS
jgi:hypothetical protein